MPEFQKVERISRQARISALNGVLEMAMRVRVDGGSVDIIIRKIREALAAEMDVAAEDQIDDWHIIPQE